ncbi:hypothetical protein MNB_SV-13-1101 [hydrothermal vent metagenome]|uniref:YcxB-like C-terminal domain-containing protein n=1 Tax=hydrothermal vent metagenome TaxID=652676 RepID=A0A1W1D0S5_9ZZZZ
MSIFKPIEISYIWDRANFEKAFEKSYTHQFKNSARRYIGWFFVAMAQFGVVGAFKGGTVGLLMLSTILILYWYVIKKWLVKKRAISAYENSPLKNSQINLEITKDGVKQNNTLIPWEALKGLVPIEDDILLYYSDKTFYIPSNAFENIEAKSALKTLAKEKGKLFHV